MGFCNWVLQYFHDGEIDHQLTNFSQQSWFYLHWEVSSQNKKYWSSQDKSKQTRLHDPKIGVWLL